MLLCMLSASARDRGADFKSQSMRTLGSVLAMNKNTIRDKQRRRRRCNLSALYSKLVLSEHAKTSEIAVYYSV